jgi:hypothetical protein
MSDAGSRADGKEQVLLADSGPCADHLPRVKVGIVPAEIERFLALDDNELLMEIAYLDNPRAPLGSPGHLVEAGFTVVQSQVGQMRKAVCARKEFLDSPEFGLATALLGVLVDHLTLGLASAVAAYTAKRGLLWLCESDEADAE